MQSIKSMQPYHASPIHALQLLSLFYFVLIISTTTVSNGTVSAYDRGCSKVPFTPNRVSDKEQAELRVLVPNITSLRQFVDCSDPTNVRGFCIDVFEMALSILPPFQYLSSNVAIHYTCFNFSSSKLTYNDMVELVADGTYDAVIGDVTIGAHRLSRVDFTHTFMESGMVIMAKVNQSEISQWKLFGWPFSLRMWCTIVGAFALTGLLVCYLDKNDHPEFTQGSISQRFGNIIWFTMEALVLLERESLKSTVARGVMLGWLFFVVLLTASYTAGLSSFLTVPVLSTLSPPTQDIVSLKDSGKPIGIRRGSIVHDYLTQRFHIPEERLVRLRMGPEFFNNLTAGPDHGGVVAVVDELPYTNILLSTLSPSNCDFGIVGPQLTQEGFGFGFNKKRNLEAVFSIALMNLTESGCLRDIQDGHGISGTSKCSVSTVPSSKVTWKSSISLVVPLLISLFLCILMHYMKIYFRSQRSRLNKDPSVVDHSTNYMYPNIPHRHHIGEIELQQYPY